MRGHTNYKTKGREANDTKLVTDPKPKRNQVVRGEVSSGIQPQKHFFKNKNMCP